MANYTPTGDYLDRYLPADQKALVESYQSAWDAAKASGNQAGMDAAHAAAEAIRATQPIAYSGGADGSEFIRLSSGSSEVISDSDALSVTSSSGGGAYLGGAYSAYQMPSANSAETYIRDLYKAQENANIAALRAAYDQNVLTLDAAASKLPAQYNDARNRLYGEAEIERAAFNERAAAQGLNSGTGTQIRLSMDNALLGNLGAISRDESNRKSDFTLERAKLDTAFKNGVADAVSKGNLAMARDLIDDFMRVDASLLSTAKAQADEDYRAYSSLQNLLRATLQN